jgi:hypothetical protein
VSAYTKFISVFLLVAFCRVLVPDSLVLALHRHTHTEEKRIPHPAAKHQLGEKHVHCPVEHLFDSSFYHLPVSAGWLVINTPLSYVKQYFSTWKFTFPSNTYLRGPPSLLTSIV